MSRVRLTVADHDRNGFVSLAEWGPLPEQDARRFIAAIDAMVSDDAEPDIKTAPFTFILDLVAPNEDLIDTGKRHLPTQTAMSLAPEQVQHWLSARPDPDSVFHRTVDVLPLGGLERVAS